MEQNIKPRRKRVDTMSNCRKAEKKELSRICEIYGVARRFMRDNGNDVQWGESDAPESRLEADIEAGNLYVLEEKGELYGVFAFIVGDDPAYSVIEQGEWKSDTPYAAIHRVASDGSRHQVLGRIMEFAKNEIPHIRIDTYEKNLVMQKALAREGFEKRGIIHVADGTPRIAYEWVR